MTKQIETATVVATITLAGNAKAVITGAYISGSPVTVSFAVLLGDNASAVALAARTALALNAAVSDQYQVSGATDKIILTDRTARANDSTLNIATDNNGCTGITAAASSADTQAGAGLTNSYATLAEFKLYSTTRGATAGTDVNDDTVIEDLLEKTSRYIDHATGRRFWYNAADETRYYSPESSRVLFFDDLSAAPTSIKCDYGLDRSYSQLLSSSDYDLEPYNAALDSRPYSYLELNPATSEYLPVYPKGVQIIGKFGWPAVPDDIKSACLGITFNVYQSRTGQSSAGNVTVTSAGVVIRPQDVSAVDQKILDHYRKLV
jgi:hypothetical protein